jgi:hypothetical protein
MPNTAEVHRKPQCTNNQFSYWETKHTSSKKLISKDIPINVNYADNIHKNCKTMHIGSALSKNYP